MEAMFNPGPVNVMHIDLNSCFATIEQQANPLLRGKPVAVGAYTSPNGCILAASVEAKRLGIKTGMRVRDGVNLCPKLIVLPPDPEKYRFINHRLQALLRQYSAYLSVESIDEIVLKIADRRKEIVDIAKEIKYRIKNEIGEWLTVSIGIAPNRYLAKVASELHKPDGLDSITRENIEEVLATLSLTDLCGIKEGNSRRLRCAGISSAIAFYKATPQVLVQAFHSKVGWQWWQRLHGYEDGVMYKEFEDEGTPQKTFGQSFALGKFRMSRDPQVWKILTQLVVKMTRRLRSDGFTACGISVSCLFADYSYWNKNKTVQEPIYSDRDVLPITRILLQEAPQKAIKIIAVTSFALSRAGTGQLPLWDTGQKKRAMVDALDSISNRWGEFTVVPGSMLGMEQKVLDRIAFGRVRREVGLS